MTREEIMAMANEAAARHGHSYEPDAGDGTIEFLGSFAALVAEKEREKCIDLVAFHGGSVEIEASMRARGQA